MSNSGTDESNGGEEQTKVKESTCKEAQQTLNQQISKVESVDRKAIGIFRANLILAGLLLTSIGVLASTENISPADFFNIWSIAGITSLVLSTVLAAMTYTTSSYEVGISQNFVKNVEEGRFESQEDLQNRLLTLYTGWLKHNSEAETANKYLITGSIIAIVDSMIFFLIAPAVGFAGRNFSPESILMFIAFLILLSILNVMIWKADSILMKLFIDEGE